MKRSGAAELRKRLDDLEGKSYGAYKSLKGLYDFELFRLSVDYVQGDPFAAPSRLRVFVPSQVAGFPASLYANSSRAIAWRDFLARSFSAVAQRHSRSCGSGKSGLLSIDRPGQQVLNQTAVLFHDDLEVRFVVGLPANGRRILGRQAARLLCDVLPELVEQALLATNLDSAELTRHVEVVEDADAMRAALETMNLVAFIGDGSILPRASGIDPGPLGCGAAPFLAPDDLAVTMQRPNAGPIRGMGIPRGVSVIVGGGYHGKSTLLRAIEMGVYNHIPGDGREACVTDVAAVKVRSEDGRAVTQVSISPFINNLPGGQDTEHFTTSNASGSTSQAASMIEAIEAGAKVLMMDEDTSATNFMIRDRRMQALIAKEHEPITPFTDKVRQIYREYGISTLLVMGGCGDYFDSADLVIAMSEYQPKNVTQQAKDIAAAHKTGRCHEGGDTFGVIHERRLHERSFDARRGKKDVFIRVDRLQRIAFGESEIDLSALEQLVHESQLRTIAYALVRLRQDVDGLTVRQFVERFADTMHHKGLEAFHGEPVGDLAAVRSFELAATVSRLRSLAIELDSQ